MQPGSIITGQGYGWSLLADHLSILNQGSLDSQNLVSESSSESSKPTPTGTTPVDVHSDILAIAVARVVAARSEPCSLPANLATGLTNDDLSNLSVSGHANSVRLATIATPNVEQPAPATPAGSMPQSPIGVATPAPPVTSSTTPVHFGDSRLRAVPAQAFNLDTPTVHAVTGWQTTNDLHAVPITLGNTLPEPGGSGGNQATINFLSYFGGSGPDSVNSLAVRTENGKNFIYVAGSYTDSGGRTDAFAAKLTEGATTVVWAKPFLTSTAGPDTASGLALNGNSVYLAGSFADPTAAVGTDGFVAQLDATTGAFGSIGTLPNANLAAITTDSAGNVDAAGWVPDPDTPGRQDVAFLQVTGDLLTQNYSNAFTFPFLGMDANSSITTGAGLTTDAQGNAYFAGTVGAVGDPNKDTHALFGRLNATGDHVDWAHAALNQTPGPGGMGTAVALDPNGNVVITGSVNETAGTPLNQDLYLARYDQTTGSRVDQFTWIVDDRTLAGHRVGDWTGNGLVVLADGSSIVTGAAFDPGAKPPSVPSKGIDVHMTHFVATDDNTTQNVDGDPENIFGGSGTDVGNAVALDPTNPTNAYMVGSTNSTDLPTTSGVVQLTYVGGSTTGFVGQVSIM